MTKAKIVVTSSTIVEHELTRLMATFAGLNLSQEERASLARNIGEAIKHLQAMARSLTGGGASFTAYKVVTSERYKVELAVGGASTSRFPWMRGR